MQFFECISSSGITGACGSPGLNFLGIAVSVSIVAVLCHIPSGSVQVSSFSTFSPYLLFYVLSDSGNPMMLYEAVSYCDLDWHFPDD